MMSRHALTCHFTALASTRSFPRGPKCCFCMCVFFIPPRSISRDPLSPCMSFCSLCTSHMLMMLFHVFARRLSTLVFSRRPICGLKWLFCMFCLTSPSMFRDPLSPGVSICSPRLKYTLSIWCHAFHSPGQALVCSMRSVRGTKWLFGVCFIASLKLILGFSAPRYVSLPHRHVSHSYYLMTCISPAWPGARKLQVLRHWAKIVVFEFSSRTKISYFC
jgi:hypothetical protein